MTTDPKMLKDELLLATLPNVPFDGWTDRALATAADVMGIEPADARRLFPGGGPDLVDHFSDWADRQMLVLLEERGAAFEAMKVREKIALAVRTRLEVLEPYKEAVRRAAAVLALPTNAGLGARLVYRTVDAMWRAAGDTSTDYNFYTKRGLLAAVQTSTTFYWLADRSEGHENTWAFLDRRIADVLAVGRRLGGAGRLAGLFGVPFRLAAGFKGRFRQAG